jgi:hypothetical protein
MGNASSWKIAAGCFFVVTGASLGFSQVYAAPAAAPSLDYDYFKTRVEPVFLTKRDGHTRCVVCHTQNNAPFHLVPLPAGGKMWTDEQSRQNFELIKRVAIPGSMDSPLIHHPLAQEAGGDPHHGGGQQFNSQQDPAWQTLRAFIMGAKPS